MKRELDTRSAIILISALCLPYLPCRLMGRADRLIGPAVVSAQEKQTPEVLARGHFQLGSTYYSSGRFEEAAQEFEKAYNVSQRPQLLYNIYLAYRELNRLEPAADALRRYLASDVDDPRRERLEARLRAMEEAIRNQEEERKALAAAVQPVEPARKEMPNAGVDTNADAQAASTPSAEVPSETRGRYFTVPSIAAFAVAGTGIVTTIIFGTLAVAKKSSVEKECAPNCTDSDVKPIHTFRTLADVGLGFAVVGAVAGGLFWYFSGGSGEKAHAQASALPEARAKNTGFDLSWRF